MLFLILFHGKTLIYLCLHLLILAFMQRIFSSSHRTYLPTSLPYQISYDGWIVSPLQTFLPSLPSSKTSFIGELPHLIHLIIILSNYPCFLSSAITPRIFYLLKFCIHLIFHFSDLLSGITPCLCHCLIRLLTFLIQLLLQTMHASSAARPHIFLNHLFQYVKRFLVVVNGTLVLWYFIVYLGSEMLNMVLQICQLYSYLYPHQWYWPFCTCCHNRTRWEKFPRIKNQIRKSVDSKINGHTDRR